MADDSPIRNVADTARWVAFYRAMETERPDAIFRDPYARRLAGARGEAIVDDMTDGRAMAWPMVVRTAVMDELISAAVVDGIDTVLNLAAGLDTRAYRMALPPSLHWIDVDQAETVAYKSSAMAGETPVCRYEFIALDLADVPARRALFDRIDATARRTLVITEGLLIYLDAASVEALATDLHAMRSAEQWLTDLASPALLRWMEKDWGRKAAQGNAPFRFGPANGPAFFAPFGWREAEYRSQMDEGIRLGRVFRFARFFRWLGKFAPPAKRAEMRYFSGILLLRRARSGETAR